MVRCNCVALAGSVLGAGSILLPWLTVRSSRLAAGDGLSLLETAGPAALVVAALWFGSIAASLGAGSERKSILFGICSALLLPITLLIAGTAATDLLATAERTARASLGAGIWVSLLAAYVLIHTSQTELKARTRLRRIISWSGPAAVMLFGMLGLYSDISLMREFAGNEQRFAQEAVRHLTLA
ncbi:MAG: hypothetical protein ACOC9B_02740, partial [Chloroflexota bacterium]